MSFRNALPVLSWLMMASVGLSADWGMKEGTPEIKSVGPLAFGPDGILFVADPKAATIFAIETGDTKHHPNPAKLEVKGINKEIASLLKSEEVTINDLAVNPISGSVYLSVTKGKGADSKPAIVKVDEASKLSEVSLKKVKFQKVELPDAAEDKEVSVGGRPPRNPRMDSITDLAYAEGKVFASGVIAGASPTSIHQVPFPFAEGLTGTSVEIYHGAHGKQENNASMRTIVPMNINGQPSILAGFICTPLVRFPVDSLKPSETTKGTTVAELGNMNVPLDMIVYKKDGKDFLLLSNNNRGVMKISTDDIARNDGITTRISGTAGQSYETIKELTGVTQLDKLGADSAVLIATGSDGSQDLKTIPLP
jgi:hypothetical protein